MAQGGRARQHFARKDRELHGARRRSSRDRACASQGHFHLGYGLRRQVVPDSARASPRPASAAAPSERTARALACRARSRRRFLRYGGGHLDGLERNAERRFTLKFRGGPPTTPHCFALAIFISLSSISQPDTIDARRVRGRARHRGLQQAHARGACASLAEGREGAPRGPRSRRAWWRTRQVWQKDLPDPGPASSIK